MEPKLHQCYTAVEAVAAFGEAGSPEYFCANQFVVFPQFVICLFTLGNAPDQSRVCSPSSVTWKPHQLDYGPSDPSDEYPSLPKKAREVWDPNRMRFWQAYIHRLFVRLPGDERFFYAGPAHLGSYGRRIREERTIHSAEFSLQEKLPLGTWLRLGGYPGWLVMVNENRQLVDDGDVATFRRLLEPLRQQAFWHLSMTNYEEDSFTVHANEHRCWMNYTPKQHDSMDDTYEPKFAGNDEATEVFKCACGIDREIPLHQTASRDLAFQALEEFFRTGELSRCVTWRHHVFPSEPRRLSIDWSIHDEELPF